MLKYNIKIYHYCYFDEKLTKLSANELELFDLFLEFLERYLVINLDVSLFFVKTVISKKILVGDTLNCIH